MPQIETTLLKKLVATDDVHWRLDDRGDQVELSSQIPLGQFGLMALVCALLWLPCLLFTAHPQRFACNNDSAFFNACYYAWLLGFPLLLLAKGLHALASKWIGPRYIVDRVRHLLTLPKIDRTWPLSAVIGWQIISRVSRKNNRCKCQLIVVISDEGEATRYLLFAGIGRGMPARLRELVRQTSERTGLPLVSYVENGKDQIGG